MSHRSVVNLMEDVAASLADNVLFDYGRRSDFNVSIKKHEVFIWMLPLTCTPTYTTNNNTENYQKTWNCNILFFKDDRSDSDQSQFKPILDAMDDLLDKFVNRLNDWSLNSTDVVGAVTLRNFNQQPFIKADSDIYTGWLLTFQMTVSDDFFYCAPENIELYGNQ